jgi:hypothetical protein
MYHSVATQRKELKNSKWQDEVTGSCHVAAFRIQQ